MSSIVVTGGAGFIGSAVVRRLLETTTHDIVNVDKLTYASTLASLEAHNDHPRHHFHRTDICEAGEIGTILDRYRPSAVVHLAAESHVDRSIADAGAFVRTNVLGTYTLLDESLRYWRSLASPERATFRFVHVSTDEVYGSLGATGRFTESSPYDPHSPYSASKAGADHLVRAWHHTYGMPTLVTNCSNNYGPFQFPEKLIPQTIQHALLGKSIPVYGRGENVRDWLFVEDHVAALSQVAGRGSPGATYNIGGHSERRNIDVVERICDLVDELAPSAAIGRRRALISFVTDRPGHDLRYAMDTTRMQQDFGWAPRVTFDDGLRRTVAWYLANQDWCAAMHARSAGGRGTARAG